VIREEDRVQRCEENERRERRFIREKENVVFDSLIYLEPVQRFKNRSKMMKFRSFGDSTNSRVKGKLKTIRLCFRYRLN